MKKLEFLQNGEVSSVFICNISLLLLFLREQFWSIRPLEKLFTNIKIYWSNPQSHLLTALIGGLILLLGTNAGATGFTEPEQQQIQSAAQGCTLSFTSSAKPITLIDCDGSGAESGDWAAPSAKAGDGCGPISLLQTAGPTPGMEIPIGKYDLTYTAMAVDKKTLEIVRITQTISIETKQDIEAPSIKKIKDQSFKKNDKIPDFSKIAGASDNCTVQAKLRFAQQPPAGTPYDGRLKSIRLTVTDAAGNQTTSNITVINH